MQKKKRSVHRVNPSLCRLCRTLADVDKDGKLKAEEFILAMHLVDMAKTGQPLPLALPTELVPPSLRYAHACDSIPLCTADRSVSF